MFLIMNKMAIRAKKAISLNNISLATCQNNISNICQDSGERSRALLFVLFCFLDVYFLPQSNHNRTWKAGKTENTAFLTFKHTNGTRQKLWMQYFIKNG